MSNEKFSESCKTAKSIFAAKMLSNIKQSCLVIEADAKEKCPVDLGILRSSITSSTDIEKNEVIGHVGSNLEYAPYVHQGTGIYAKDGNGRKTPWRYKGKKGHFIITHGQRPQPFLENAKTSNMARIQAILREGLT